MKDFSIKRHILGKYRTLVMALFLLLKSCGFDDLAEDATVTGTVESAASGVPIPQVLV